MAAVLVIVEPQESTFDARATNAALTSWGNWYIKRTSHEFGWASHYACLNYFGMFVAGHKILFDTPSHVRFVDVAVGQIKEPLLRQSLALEYWWLREVTTGTMISDREKAEVLELGSPSQFRETVRTAKIVAQRVMEALDRRRESATIS